MGKSNDTASMTLCRPAAANADFAASLLWFGMVGDLQAASYAPIGPRHQLQTASTARRLRI
jgi:hypothetical protein